MKSLKLKSDYEMFYTKKFPPWKCAQSFWVFFNHFRDRRQFVKQIPLLHFMFLMDNFKLYGPPNKAKLNEKYTLVFILFQVWKILLTKGYSYQFFYFSVFFINFYINRYHFHNSLAFHSTLSEKRFFCQEFSLFNRSTPVRP